MTIIRNMVVATGMAAAATTIGLATQAHADPEYYRFQSPSGNIHCELTINYKGTPYADCTIQQSGYADRVCQQPGLVIPQFVLSQGSPGDLPGCTGTNGGWPALPTLDYGQTQSVATITCDSQASGVTCTDSSTGHFFRLSAESYDVG